jgi:hypothetical protein
VNRIPTYPLRGVTPLWYYLTTDNERTHHAPQLGGNLYPMDDCIEWEGAKTGGYGVLKVDGRLERAHRFAFFMHYGRWPDVCRHTCDNPGCINVDHLVDGTQADNMADKSNRGRHHNSRKTHCPRGHEYTPENTRESGGGRWCRTCDNLRGREKRKRGGSLTGACQDCGGPCDARAKRCMTCYQGGGVE